MIALICFSLKCKKTACVYARSLSYWPHRQSVSAEAAMSALVSTANGNCQPTLTPTHLYIHTISLICLDICLLITCVHVPTFQLIFPLDHMSHMRYVDPADSWLSAWMSWLLVSWGQHVTFVIYCKWHFTALGMNSVSGAYSHTHTHTAIYILNVFNVSVCSLRDCECLFDVLHDIQNI